MTKFGRENANSYMVPFSDFLHAMHAVTGSDSEFQTAKPGFESIQVHNNSEHELYNHFLLFSPLIYYFYVKYITVTYSRGSGL